MAPPHDGNECTPFEQMIKLERLAENKFHSTALPFTPGGKEGGRGAAYGGHVYAQAAWAACQTVAKGFLLSNVSGNFILPGIPDVKFVYHVQNIRDGRSYCTRIVNVSQSEGKGFMFTCTCVFKKAETGPLDVQANVNIWDKYKVALEGKKPVDFEKCPGFDVPWYWRAQKEGKPNDQFPGLDTRKVDMTLYNKDKHALDKRQLIFFRSIGTLSKDPNMHLCAMLYASDRNSLFIVANAYGIGDLYSNIGSLVHQVIFHTSAEDLDFGEDRGPHDSRWYAKEDWTTRYTAGRGLFYSRVWSPEGKHVMTVTQDGLIRMGKGTEDQVKAAIPSWENIEEAEVRDIKELSKI